MDKQKTGVLIREARIKKNYTQSELGDLLGVSNKAISRWENGDSFPDVALLENLAVALDIRIQDIIIGATEEEESVVTEVVRAVRLQQKEKKRKAIRISGYVVAILFCIIAGLSALGDTSLLFSNNSILGHIFSLMHYFVNESILVYVILMVASFALILSGITTQSEMLDDTYKLSKCIKGISLLSMVWGILMTLCSSFIISNGSIPFGMELSDVGPFISVQLTVLFVLNLIIVVVELYRFEKSYISSHLGCFSSVAVMYLTVLYNDMLHRMNFQEIIKMLIFRTIIVLISLGTTLIVAKTKKKKLSKTDYEVE